jgi:hypothetical protein
VAASALAGAVAGTLGIAAAQTDTSTTSTSEAPAATSTTEAPAAPGTTASSAAPETTSSTATPETTTSTAAPETTTTTAAPSTTTTAPGASNGATAPSARSGTDGHDNGETPLTGEVADKVKAAALAAVPGGTIDRVETDSDGSPYEAHVTKSDGTHVTVKVDSTFKVTAVEAGGRH